MEQEREHLVGYLAALGTVAIWSGFILISRWGGRTGLTPYDVLALRLGTAALLLLPFCRDMAWSHWRDGRLWSLALLGGVGYGVLVYAGFKTAPAAHGAILLPGLQPFLVAAAAWLISGTRMARERLLGLVCIGLGVLPVAWPMVREGSAWSADLLWGDGLILLASVVWAFYSVLARRWGFSPWLLTRFVALASALVFLPTYLMFLPKALGSVPVSVLLIQGLYQGIGPTIVAMLLFLRAVAILGAERTGAMIALVPVLAGLAAVPVLGEQMSVWLLGGLVLVSAGAFMAARPVSRMVRSQTCPT